MVTAIVNAFNRDNSLIACRILIDTCSTANFITEDLATALQLPRIRCNLSVGALDGLATRCKQQVIATIRSRYNNYCRTLKFYIVSRLATHIPDTQINRTAISIPANIPLADPEFHKPAPVQMLISAGPALSTLSVGQINLSSPGGQDLYLQKTQLGWVIGGSIDDAAPTHDDAMCHLTASPTDLSTFWEIEEGAPIKYLSDEERECERHFSTHIARNAEGRYVVALPFKRNIQQLGRSRANAQKRLSTLERKFELDPDLKHTYMTIIKEYLALGYLTKVTNPREEGFYLPHHAITKATSQTTKTRIVYDGSAVTATGISLNNTLMVGPTIQDDIFSIILRFHLHKYVLTGDIEKMYLQVLLRPEDRKFQRILWRDEAREIQTYELNTVTFGLSASHFLAIRTLHQLAEDERENYPIASSILKKDIYVDDILTGADTINEAMTLRDEMISLLRSGGFNLRQCASNASELLHGLTDQTINLQLQSNEDRTLKTLGIYWNSQKDAIICTVKKIKDTQRITKRTILSEIAKIFDPLGLLQAIIVNAKLIMQELWKVNIDWDESVPLHIHTQWTDFASQLPQLHNATFPRNVLIPDTRELELHGFCDASEKAYGACIYLRSIDHNGQIYSQILCSRSRVAPIKKTQTIPRLELCGALLLVKLYLSTRSALNNRIKRALFWTDSTIVLYWISKSPHLLKTFVANRISEIQSHTQSNDWKHVRTHENPADQLSRGQTPSEFLDNDLWKTGPAWLRQHEEEWPQLKLQCLQEDKEARKLSCFTTSTINNEIFERFSSVQRLYRIISYCLRWKKENNFKGPLSVIEIRETRTKIIRTVQAMEYQQEIHDLKVGKTLHTKSRLLSLNVFLDEAGILRSGGRLQRANISRDQQHPILLPRSGHITQIIIKNEHVINGHAGIQATLYSLRRRYWLIDGRNRIRKIIHACVKCTRAKPPAVDYVMGELPKDRITAARPFSKVGIDYCGPFYIKEKRFRNRLKIKVYVAVFVCLVVKAIHMEIVSDMTTEGFIAALRRFIARREKPHVINSDNGSNFVGARNEINELQQLLASEEHNSRIHSFLLEREITRKLIPPLSPHFGGIWEAAVKSFKHHMRRVIGNALLSFEDFNTYGIEIESILNSRPLTPLSSDPNDPLALTPGHFLIGESLTSLPEHDFGETKINRLSTWQHVQKLKQDFWARWQKEYINELNIRRKWSKGAHAIDLGSIVVIKDENLPPLR